MDPNAGRFTTRDTIGIWGDPAEFGNGYSFVGNSPLSWLDPLGLGRCQDGDEEHGNSDDILTDPDDPCHSRCKAKAKNCITQGLSKPRCSRDRNRCVRFCNQRKKSHKESGTLDQYGADDADWFWDRESETRFFGHFVDDIQDETAAERDIREATEFANALDTVDNGARQVRRQAVGAIIDISLSLIGVPPGVIFVGDIAEIILIDAVNTAE
jgi:hypothetical protein